MKQLGKGVQVQICTDGLSVITAERRPISVACPNPMSCTIVPQEGWVAVIFFHTAKSKPWQQGLDRIFFPGDATCFFLELGLVETLASCCNGSLCLKGILVACYENVLIGNWCSFWV